MKAPQVYKVVVLEKTALLPKVFYVNIFAVRLFYLDFFKTISKAQFVILSVTKNLLIIYYASEKRKEMMRIIKFGI